MLQSPEQCGLQSFMALSALIFSVVSFVISCVLSYVFFKKNRDTSVQPMLVFVRKADDDDWYLQNLGNGPALGLIVVDGSRQEGWKSSFRFDPLAKDGSVSLNSLPIKSKLGATYKDIHGKQYNSVCFDYNNTVGKGALPNIPSPNSSQFHVQHNT